MLVSLLLATFALGDPDPADLEFFEKEVRPVLVKRCQSCHGADKQKGDLRLDSRAAALKGGKAGPAVVPGKLEESVLIEAINYGDLVQMPPKSKLPAKEIAALTKWVERGAVWPAEAEKKDGESKPKVKPFNLKERSKHWSFQPIHRVEPPAVKDTGWASSPIDRFLLASLEAKGLKPARETDKRTLIRRATFDLTGLPPTPAEIDAFMADNSPHAFAKVVDRLLASPRYGERWGRHWLDLVRFAETSGHEFDYEMPDAWRYRDYVVRAINDDLPYDQFLTEHIAGDLIAKPRRNPVDGANESILATGFYFLGEGTHSPVDVRDEEILRIDNQIDVLSKTFLGLTVSCARCHDHKFDPIATKDYYALTGYFKSSRFQHAMIDSPELISSKVAALSAIKQEIARGAGGVRIDDSTIAYERAARRVIANPGTESPSDLLFDDFEGDRYDKWTAEGRAFGDGPLHLPVPDYQGAVGAKGRGLVGSHNGRLVGSVIDRDALTGTLTSKEFTIERNYIHFLVGGGSHAGKTCINLMVDGKVVASVTGREENPMRPNQFDVRQYRGKPARLQVVDDDSGGWGNISLDHVVFSDWSSPPDSPDRVVLVEAESTKLDANRLARWVKLLGSAPAKAVASADSSVLFEDFEKPFFESWSVSGEAFGDRPTQAGAFRVDAGGASPLSPGIAHSGQVSDRLQGVLRSKTFKLEHKYVRVLCWGKSGRVNVVVDGFEKIRDPIYGGLCRTIDSESPQWVTIDVGMWQGHRAYLELGDGATLDYNGSQTKMMSGDGYLAVDEIRFGDGHAPALPSAPGLANLGDDLLRWKNGGFGTGRQDAALARHLQLHRLIEFSGDRIAPLLMKYRELEATIPRPTLAISIIDGTGENENVLIRGSAKTPGELVPRRFLEVIAGASQESPASGSGRLELARKMLDASNPLTPRVMVNRIWKGHFGVGLVKTPDDFGVMGEAPSHPELLDWLASEFVAQKWSVKAMHRLMMLSSAYRMSSELDPNAETIDGANRLLHRTNIRRMEAEGVRDSMLFVSGRLNPTMGGPGVPPHLTALMEGRGKPTSSGPLDGDGRRSIYLNVRRNFLSPMLLAFDFPAPASTMGRRNVSNVPAQALTLLDDPFVLSQAKLWADRLLAMPLQTDGDRVDRAFVEAFGRPATIAERDDAIAFLKSFEKEDSKKGWTDLCHALFNAKEFLFIP